jgi:hypothetical protein
VGAPCPDVEDACILGKAAGADRRREVSGLTWNQLTASSSLVAKMLSQCSCRVSDIIDLPEWLEGIPALISRRLRPSARRNA